MKRFLLLLFLIAKCSTHEITNLPGLDYELNFKQYAGFLNASATDRFFYWLVESQNNVMTDPLIFWLDGGPGCSSLSGLLEKNGPFFINPDTHSLRENKYSWNKLGSVVYLESPSGVGFSHSTTSTYRHNDVTTATHNYEAIKQFFKEHPKYRLHDVVITGESYAGIYIPLLADKIIDGQKDFEINLKAIAIGNGLVSFGLMVETSLTYSYTHGMFDEEEFNRLVDGCCNKKLENCNILNSNKPECREIIRHGMYPYYPELNIYNINEQCEDNSWTQTILNGYPKFGGVKGCRSLHQSIQGYLNRKDVREALRIPYSYKAWKACDQKIMRNYLFSKLDVDDYVKKAIGHGVRTLLFYGDADLVCPFMMGQIFADRLKLDVVEPYRPWLMNGIVAGYRFDYQNLTYMSIRDAGHSCSVTHPEEMLKVIGEFIKGYIPEADF